MTRRLAFVAGLLVLPATLVQAAAVPPAAGKPLHARIDQMISAGKDFARFKAPQASDGEFLRRIYLDLVGFLPTSTEARAFFQDATPNRRQAVIDRLLASPEHARHMAHVFDVMLMERLNPRSVPQATWHEYLRSSFAANKPWDVMAREILSGDGSDPKQMHRAKFFLERNGEAHVLTRDISRLFLGTDFQCAQCHDHPRVEEYKQDMYYGLYAFLERTTVVNDRKTRTVKLSEKAVGETTFQSVFDPAKKTLTALPRVPGSKVIKDPPVDKSKLYIVAPSRTVAGVPTYSRRAQLATALARPDYLPFRRNIANRLWAHMMGRGLVDPLDMDHPANPPSHPELLDLLSDEIAARKFDMRNFLRELALSETYQRSSILPDKVDPKEAPLYASAILKPLSPEQMSWSLIQASGLMELTRTGLGKSASEATVYARLSPVTTALVRTFAGPAGQPQGFDARMDQALFLANGVIVRSWLPPRTGNLADRLGKLKGDAFADELYLSIFTRLPDPEERKEVTDFLAKKSAGLPDLIWALLASTEFRFNH